MSNDLFTVVGAGVYDEGTEVLSIFAPALEYGLDVIDGIPDDVLDSLSIAPDTTWDTDEVIRWIDNDEPLYHLTRHLARTQIDLAGTLASEVHWERYNADIDVNLVDWDHVATYLTEEEL